MKDIISSPLLLILVAIGLIYIVVFSLIHLKKAYTRCLELGITFSSSSFTFDENDMAISHPYSSGRLYA